jgi:hypothetical protein
MMDILAQKWTHGRVTRKYNYVVLQVTFSGFQMIYNTAEAHVSSRCAVCEGADLPRTNQIPELSDERRCHKPSLSISDSPGFFFLELLLVSLGKNGYSVAVPCQKKILSFSSQWPPSHSVSCTTCTNFEGLSPAGHHRMTLHSQFAITVCTTLVRSPPRWS